MSHSMTAEELLALPEDGNRYELLDGDLVSSALPPWRHQEMVGILFRQLAAAAHASYAGMALPGPVAVELAPNTVVQPDLVFIGRDRYPALLADPRKVTGAPDIVVEVTTEETHERDRETKRALYARAGIAEYWLADLNAYWPYLTVFTPGEGLWHDVRPNMLGILQSRRLPKLRIDSRACFDELSPAPAPEPE